MQISFNAIQKIFIVVRMCRRFECIHIRRQIWHKQPVWYNVQSVVRYRTDGRQYLPCLLACYCNQLCGAVFRWFTLFTSRRIIAPRGSLSACSIFDGCCRCSVFIGNRNNSTCVCFRYGCCWGVTVCTVFSVSPICSVFSVYTVLAGCSSVAFFSFFAKIGRASCRERV